MALIYYEVVKIELGGGELSKVGWTKNANEARAKAVFSKIRKSTSANLSVLEF